MNLRSSILVTICLTLGLGWAGMAQAATLSLAPATGVYTAGTTFTTRLVVNTQGDPINAAEATLRFNPSQLSVVAINKGSTFSLWAVEPAFSNAAGTLNFGGGSPAGYTGRAGTVLSITWRSKGAGTAKVSFSNGSVLAADGRGTNVVRSLNGGSYTVMAADVQPEPETIEYVAPANTPARPSVTSDSHPNEEWSQETTAQLSWSLPSGVTAVRTLLDGNSGSIPTHVYTPPISSITLDDLSEGVQYFHLQFKNENGWGRVAHYRLAVDTESPSDFTITLADAYEASSPTQELVFTVTDAVSPVTRYRVQHNGGESYEYIDETGSSTMLVNELTPGEHNFIVEAYDAAGNSRIATYSFTIESFGAPEWTEYPTEVRASVVPVLRGHTRPDATVFATMAVLKHGQQGAVPLEYEVTADAEGNFTVIPDGRLPEGVYELTAYAIDTHGSQSAVSAVVRMSVTPPGYIAVGQFMVSVMSVLVPLLALLLLLVLLIVYGVARIRTVRKFVRTETIEALTVIKKHFVILEDSLAAQATALAATRKSKKLTNGEQDLVDTLKTKLSQAQAEITREVAEVDDIVE